VPYFLQIPSVRKTIEALKEKESEGEREREEKREREKATSVKAAL
jgi:hypothetical protein